MIGSLSRVHLVVDEAVNLQDAVPHVDAFTFDPLFEQLHGWILPAGAMMRYSKTENAN